MLSNWCKKEIKKVCKYCGKEFILKANNQVHCSKQCRAKYCYYHPSQIVDLPLCKCGCGRHVIRQDNTYLTGHNNIHYGKRDYKIRTCSLCKCKYKPTGPTQLYCDGCKSVSSLQSIYKLTLDKYNDMMVKQFNKCIICECDFDVVKSCIDHSHTNGEVRGLLCGLCNKGLGCFKDDITLLKKAIEYLA
jgi:hypothetical protein